ncbi:MAG: hypothetical protein WC333_08800 [Dehalococcoidia bacterium]|jgi:hypothetical protein
MEKYLKPLIFLSLIVFAFTAYAVFQAAYTLSNPSELSAQDAANKAVSYINTINSGSVASLVDVTEESGLYKIHILIGQQVYESFVSKDGKLLFAQAIHMEGGSSGGGTATKEIPKSDRPDVKVFVMSYCPYGTQAQKMLLPVYDLLQDKVDMGVYFVDYAMHGKQELDENLRQYCIQSENQSQYFDYLSCFVQSGDPDACIAAAGIDTDSLTSCIAAADATYNVTGQFNDQSTWVHGDPVFDIHKDLCELYGVTGSPTVIINGIKVSVNPRSPENFKQIICSAFNTPPQECDQTLSTTVPSAGFD